ncbi:MAG: RICIN domain-containing protein [Bacteroidota bacterium]
MKNLVLIFVAFLCSFTTLSADNIITFSTTLRNFCPNTQEGHLINGDREFGAPVASQFNINLYVSRNNLMAEVRLYMQENNQRRNRTKVAATWRRTIYTAPKGQAVKYFSVNRGRFVTSASGSAYRLSREAGPEIFGCNDGDSFYASMNSVSAQIEYKADTGHMDVSSDKDCGCDSRIERIILRNIRVRVGKRQPFNNNEYIFRSAIGGKVMTVRGNRNANGTPTELQTLNWKNNQLFTVENAGGGYFYIKAKNGRYLHVQNNSSQPRAFAVTWAGRGNDNTKWKFIPVGNNQYYIQSKKGTYLDVQWAKNRNGTPIWLWSFNGGGAQKWELKLHVPLL